MRQPCASVPTMCSNMQQPSQTSRKTNRISSKSPGRSLSINLLAKMHASETNCSEASAALLHIPTPRYTHSVPDDAPKEGTFIQEIS